MILQALNQYYEALAARGEISPSGWCKAKVSYALRLREDGELLGVTHLKQTTKDGKRQIAQLLDVPEQVKRTVGVVPNFLCDGSGYLLGVDGKGKPARTRQCFEAARALHEEILAGVDSPAARAILAYFSRWDPEQAAVHPALSETIEDILKGANLIFEVNGSRAQDDALIRTAWQRHCGAQDAVIGRCLVTGELAPIAVLHPSIKGVRKAQSSGASLVSFNADAFESYGKEQRDKTGQGYNSPVSVQAAFAYGTALNYLLADSRHVQFIGDTTIVYWAEDAEPLYQDIFAAETFGTSDQRITSNDLERILGAMAQAKPVDVDGIPLKPENRFYVLGLAPSAARLSVRFFLSNTFGQMLENVCLHHGRLNIVPEQAPPSVWRMLDETVNPNSREKAAVPPMAGAVIRAILNDSPYPVSLFEATMMRIRAERTVTRGRAAILKAFLLKKYEMLPQEIDYPIKEVLIVPLNEESTYIPYVLGRIFATIEEIYRADGSTSSTPEAGQKLAAVFCNRYFNSACSTPSLVFPIAIKLARYHLAKLGMGIQNRINERLGQLCDCFEVDELGRTLFPQRLTNDEQGAFILGYYQQKQFSIKTAMDKINAKSTAIKEETKNV